MGSAAPIRITLLGHPTVAARLPGAVFPEKGFQLLAILCRVPKGECSRRKLASLLWDAQDDAVALANLRQLLARIRRALAGSGAALESKGQAVALGSLKAAIDLGRFQDDADAEASIALYGGDLLDSVDDATDAFLEWLRIERVALRQDFFCRAEAVLIERTKFGRAPRDLLNDIAARMLALDPEREASYRALIEAFGRNGMLDEAQRHLGALRKLLARDPNNAPAPETVAVVRRVFSVRHNAGLPEPKAERRAWQPRVMFLAPEWPHGAHNNRLMKVFIEDVANELARCRSFVVLAPHSTFQLEHESGHPSDNSQMRADYTISGFVKPDGGAGTLVLRMMKCESAEIVWSGQFRIGLQELLKSFDALVVRVASSLAEGLERNILSRRPHATDGAAYFQFLEGMQWLENCDLPRLRKARRCFKQAFATDDAIASAAARIGQTLYLEWLQMGGSDPNLLIDARAQAQLAIDIDPNDPIGHWMDGTVALYQRDFDACEAKFAEAETLCPNSPEFLLQYADALSHLGDCDTGWLKFERAIDLNPKPPDRYWWAGATIALHRHDYRKAIELCEQLDSDESVLGLLCASFAHLGDLATARSYGKRIRENFPGGSALALGRIGPDRNESQREHIIQGLRMAGVT
ncbi:MAG TPA: BTAD domain-containing putative transcriptional regulator [Rhizomicrobium sp.]|nr:BTAD domain-containing putative transcriptional regulator [Rhizomicrobium sp.]